LKGYKGTWCSGRSSVRWRSRFYQCDSACGRPTPIFEHISLPPYVLVTGCPQCTKFQTIDEMMSHNSFTSLNYGQFYHLLYIHTLDFDKKNLANWLQTTNDPMDGQVVSCPIRIR